MLRQRSSCMAAWNGSEAGVEHEQFLSDDDNPLHTAWIIMAEWQWHVRPIATMPTYSLLVISSTKRPLLYKKRDMVLSNWCYAVLILRALYVLHRFNFIIGALYAFYKACGRNFKKLEFSFRKWSNARESTCLNPSQLAIQVYSGLDKYQPWA